MIVMLDYQHNIVRQRRKKRCERWGIGEREGRGSEQRRGEQRRGEQSKARESRTEQREQRGQERAEGRGEEGRRGGVEVMMWQRQRDFKKFSSQRTQYASIPTKGKSLAQGLTWAWNWVPGSTGVCISLWTRKNYFSSVLPPSAKFVMCDNHLPINDKSVFCS